jgi:acyl carrier protein
MTQGEILDKRIAQLLLSELHLDVASSDTDLLEAGVLDSALIIEIFLLIEEHFGLQIAIEDLELDDLRSIQRISQLVSSRSSPA